MAQQAPPAQPGTFYVPRPVTLTRVLFFTAAACFFIAALTVAGAFHIGPALAWGWGGFTAWMLTGVA